MCLLQLQHLLRAVRCRTRNTDPSRRVRRPYYSIILLSPSALWSAVVVADRLSCVSRQCVIFFLSSCARVESSSISPSPWGRPPTSLSLPVRSRPVSSCAWRDQSLLVMWRQLCPTPRLVYTPTYATATTSFPISILCSSSDVDRTTPINMVKRYVQLVVRPEESVLRRIFWFFSLCVVRFFSWKLTSNSQLNSIVLG